MRPMKVEILKNNNNNLSSGYETIIMTALFWNFWNPVKLRKNRLGCTFQYASIDIRKKSKKHQIKIIYVI